MDEFLVVINGKPEGPFTFSELTDLKIQPDTFIRKPGMDDYKEAHELPELRQLFGFQKQFTKPQYFASLDVRLIAVLIDYLLVFAVYCLITLVLISFIDQKFIRIAISVSGLALIPIVKLIMSIIMEASSSQGTYGKSLLGIKITDENGKQIALSQSIARNFSKLICVATLGIGYLIGFFDKKQQGLHDKIAGTLVIKDRLL